MNPYREDFSVHSFQVDAFNRLTVPALAGLLQEAAGKHADRLGWGIDALRSNGLTWVLARQTIEVLQPVAVGARVTVSTWPSGVFRMAALREHEVLAADGSCAARALSHWFVLDFQTRRPVPPDQVETLAPQLRELALRAPPAIPGKLPALERWTSEERFQVRHHDIDINLHANNLSYLPWALEAIPVETWRCRCVAALDIQYLAECNCGDRLVSRVAADGEDAFLHAIVRETDAAEVARVRTRWAHVGESNPGERSA